jgi:hypothetical protein
MVDRSPQCPHYTLHYADLPGYLLTYFVLLFVDPRRPVYPDNGEDDGWTSHKLFSRDGHVDIVERYKLQTYRFMPFFVTLCTYRSKFLKL